MEDSTMVKVNVEITEGEFNPIENLPIITVSVLTYNSSKFVIETLNSIKSQTYPNLILQISDDCSDDNTIGICRKWIEVNKARFIKCKILLPDCNTGVSANCNRAWDNCETVYLKDVAGDDLLLPNCIEDNMKYIQENPNAIIVFSKAKSFREFWGIKCEQGYRHDYNFFRRTKEEQYSILFEVGNVLPASSVFLNIEKIREKQIRHDERIPLLEDYPKWIQMLRKDVCFHFINIDTVLYRLNDNSLSVGLFSPNFYKNNMLFYLYYFLDEIKDEKEKDNFYNIIATHETRFYQQAYNAAKNRRIIRFVDAISSPIIKLMILIKQKFINNGTL